MAKIKNKKPSIGKTMKKLEPTHDSAMVKWYSHCPKQSGCFSKRSTDLPYDPATPRLGIYPRELKTSSHKKPVHKCSLLITAKRVKTTKCPSTH